MTSRAKIVSWRQLRAKFKAYSPAFLNPTMQQLHPAAHPQVNRAKMISRAKRKHRIKISRAAPRMNNRLLMKPLLHYF